MYTFSSIRDHIIPKSVKCGHSPTKVYGAKTVQGFRAQEFEALGVQGFRGLAAVIVAIEWPFSGLYTFYDRGFQGFYKGSMK